jgi:hypothetical protein
MNIPEQWVALAATLALYFSFLFYELAIVGG